MRGTFTFTDDLPVTVIALRGFVNERSEFLMTTVLVAPASTSRLPSVAIGLFDSGASHPPFRPAPKNWIASRLNRWMTSLGISGSFHLESLVDFARIRRHSKAQRREAAIGCHILNRMAELIRPKYYAVVS